MWPLSDERHWELFCTYDDLEIPELEIFDCDLQYSVEKLFKTYEQTGFLIYKL